MRESMCRIGKTGRIMSVRQFIKWAEQNLADCKDKYIFITTGWDGATFSPSKKSKCLRIPMAWDEAGFKQPSQSLSLAEKSFNFGAIVMDKKDLPDAVLLNIKFRRNFRYLGDRKTVAEHDRELAKQNAGKVLSKAEVFELFKYSPTTYIHDTTILAKGLIVEMGRDQYKVVSP